MPPIRKLVKNSIVMSPTQIFPIAIYVQEELRKKTLAMVIGKQSENAINVLLLSKNNFEIAEVLFKLRVLIYLVFMKLLD
jgi:2-phosphoglycerate kinase